jgi:hypothetical protein
MLGTNKMTENELMAKLTRTSMHSPFNKSPCRDGDNNYESDSLYDTCIQNKIEMINNGDKKSL